MPFGDRTSTFGFGPKTGRGMGYCFYPGFLNPVRKGYFCWCGRGRGFRNWYYATGLPGWMRAWIGYPAFGMPISPFEMTEKEELEVLRREAELLQKHLKEVKEQIEILEKSIEKEK